MILLISQPYWCEGETIMSSHYCKKSGAGFAPLLWTVIASIFFVTFGPTPASAEHAEKLSEYHKINVAPEMAKRLGKETLHEIIDYFEKAELAVETGDLDGLLELYSENYKNGPHDKASARKIWKRIFETFKDMSMIHNMRIDTYSKEGKIIFIECTGILLGKPKGKGSHIPIDNWVREKHILSNENGNWRLIGSAGKERQRFWFDKPMSPLF